MGRLAGEKRLGESTLRGVVDRLGGGERRGVGCRGGGERRGLGRLGERERRGVEDRRRLTECLFPWGGGEREPDLERARFLLRFEFGMINAKKTR